MKTAPADHRPRLVAAKKAAAALGLPYTSLRDVALRGEIPIVRVGRSWFFEWTDLDRWVESHKETAA